MPSIDEISWPACSASPTASSYFLRRAKCAIQQYSGSQEPVISKCGFSRANSRRFLGGRTAFFQDVRVLLPYLEICVRNFLRDRDCVASFLPFFKVCTDSITLLPSCFFIFDDVEYYSAVMRVQYYAVAQTIMLNEYSSQAISARCNLLHSLR